MGERIEVEGSFKGYISPAVKGKGPGVLVLHAWWGMNKVFTGLCDRLAGEGFTALAPDLYDGYVATTIQDAETAMRNVKRDTARAQLKAALYYLAEHPAVSSDGLGLIGFSMGGFFALSMAEAYPGKVKACVVFYSTGGGKFTQAKAAFLGHFAETDPYEEDHDVVELEQRIRDAGHEVTFHHYEGTTHWFFEENRPEYRPAAAALAYDRTVKFLKQTLVK